MRGLILAFAAAVAIHAQDPVEIVRRAAAGDDRNTELREHYTYLQRQEQREMDSTGKVKKTESDTIDVTLLEGSTYRRHVAHNDKPLPPKEEAKEEEKLRRSIEERRKETVKHLATALEEHRTSIRNIRRDGNETVKKATKDKQISADDEKRANDEIQQMTDAAIKRVEEMFKTKEKEVMTV